MAEKEKKSAAKPAAKKNAGRKQADLYTLGEKIQRKNKTCPKCGPGMFLGTHSNRVYCGNCHYTEFVAKK